MYTFIPIIIFLLGLLLWWQAQRLQRESGLPSGEVIYSDTGTWQDVDRPLISREFGLVGKPDYLVQVRQRNRTYTIPIEVKSRRQPPTPYPNHILQLATYCILVEEQFQLRPPYGIIHYADGTLKIPFTDQLRDQVLKSADEIRLARSSPDVARQHREPKRCYQCGYRQDCGTELR